MKPANYRKHRIYILIITLCLCSLIINVFKPLTNNNLFLTLLIAAPIFIINSYITIKLYNNYYINKTLKKQYKISPKIKIIIYIFFIFLIYLMLQISLLEFHFINM